MIAIIADVHGNYPALRAVLARIDDMSCDTVISLGDVAGYYCMINECIDELRKREAINILGNHDHYLVHGEPCHRSSSANECLRHQMGIIREPNLQWLRGSVKTYRTDRLSLVHGGWKDPLDEYLLEIDDGYFGGQDQTLFMSGHTHVQALIELDGKTYCNPGSVGQPRDGNPEAAFAVLENERIELFRVEYDIEEISRQMKKAGFEEKFFMNLRNGTKIGGGTAEVIRRSK